MSPGPKGSDVEKIGLDAIGKYFDEIKTYFAAHDAPYEIGVYGPDNVLLSLGLKYNWLAYGWGSTTTAYSSENIKQVMNEVGPAPYHLDSDVALTPDFGAWNDTTISTSSAQNSLVTGSNGLLTVESSPGYGSNITIGAVGSNGVVSDGLTGNTLDTFNQFSKLLFDGGEFNDLVRNPSSKLRWNIKRYPILRWKWRRRHYGW